MLQSILIIIIVWLISYLCLCNQSTGTTDIFGNFLQYFGEIAKFVVFLAENKEIVSRDEMKMNLRNLFS